LVYVFARRSAQARVRLIEAIAARFFDDFDERRLLTAVGLYDEEVADDEAPPSEGPDRETTHEAAADPKAEYARWCELVAHREATTYGRRRTRVAKDPIRLGLARHAVLLRSEGLCENPECAQPAPDINDHGDPVLEVDHIIGIADGGHDHPMQMIALCPNCHAVKTYGRRRQQLIPALRQVAQERHDQWITATG
jgi:5-methylcytosine-specific restriction protein A